jgi:hypothetical protein
MKDPLALFNDLPDYPGRRRPKNRPLDHTVKTIVVNDPFDGVPSKTMTIKGETKEFYTVGAVAQVLGRTAQTIRKWERKGWIPTPTYRTVKASGAESINVASKGYRLYSREQVETLWNILNKLDLLGERTKTWQDTNKWISFITLVQAEWPR